MEKFGINLDDWLDNLDKFEPGEESNNREDSLEFEDVVNGNYDSIYQGIKLVFKISQDRIFSFLDSEDKKSLSLASDYFFEKVLIYEMECCIYAEAITIPNNPDPEILEIQENQKNQKMGNIFDEVSAPKIESEDQNREEIQDNAEPKLSPDTNGKEEKEKMIITKPTGRSSSKFRISSSKKIGLSSSKGFSITQNKKISLPNTSMKKAVSSRDFTDGVTQPKINPILQNVNVKRPVSNKKREKNEIQILLLPFRVYNLMIKSELSQLKKSSGNLMNMLQRWKSTVIGVFENKNDVSWKIFFTEIYEKMGQIMREYKDPQFQTVLQRLSEVEDVVNGIKDLSETIQEVSMLQKMQINPSIPELFKNLGDTVDRQSFNAIVKGVTLLSRRKQVSPMNYIYLSILIDQTLEKGIELFIASKFTFRMVFSPKSEVIYKHIKFWQKSLKSLRSSLKALNANRETKLTHIIPPEQKAKKITLKKIHKFCSLYIDLVGIVQHMGQENLKEVKSTLSLIPKGVGIFGEKNDILYKTIMVKTIFLRSNFLGFCELKS